MTVYARSDVTCVALSKAHGGCGEVHSRPVVDGAPVKLWSLTCHSCEDHLRSDSLWSSTISEIPETYDEKSVREDQERRGQREQADATAHALERLAHLGDLPTVLGRMVELMTGQQPQAAIQASQAMAQLCQNGHANAAHTKFCGECGTPLEDIGTNGPVQVIQATPEVTKGDDPETVADPSPEAASYDAQTVAELREAAKTLGVSTSGTKAELIDRLQARVDGLGSSDGQ